LPHVRKNTTEAAASNYQRWSSPSHPTPHSLVDAVYTLCPPQEIAAVRKTITEAATRNYQRWSTAIADPDFPSWDALFDAEIKQLQQWTLARLAWIDAAMAAQAEPGAGPTAYLAVGDSFKAPPPVPGTSASDNPAAVGAAAAAAPGVAVQG
jgi:hypothetical protein